MIKPGELVFALIENKVNQVKITKVRTTEFLDDDENIVEDKVVVVIYECAEYGLDSENVFETKDELIKDLIKKIEWMEQ